MSRYIGLFALLYLLLCGTYVGVSEAEADTAYPQILSESSMRYLTQEEIEDMPLQVVSYAKNEIYARNGRMFRSAELQNYFAGQSWYTALYQPDQFTADMLNTYEQYNLELLADREAQLGLYVTDAAGYTCDEVYAYIDSHRPELGDYRVDPVSQIFYDSDRRMLSEEDLSGLNARECYYASCEIYARHGVIFDSLEISDYFGQKYWYWGYVNAVSFDGDVLSDTEKANLMSLEEALLKLESDGYQTDRAGFSYADIGSYTAGAAYSAGTEDFVFRDSAIRLLTDDEVSGLTLRQLCYARNEIYARRGMIFQARELRDYFSAKCWYHPVITSARFSYADFNDYEKANIALLRSYEYSISAQGYRLY